MSHETGSVEVVRGEVLPLSINVGPALDEGDTVLSVTAEVTEQTTRAVLAGAVIGTPTVTANTLSITIDGRAMVVSNRYTLKALLTIAPDAKVIAVLTPIHCDA
jgi:hypothetical protein